MSDGSPYRDTCPKCKEKDTEIANLRSSNEYTERELKRLKDKHKAVPKLYQIVPLMMLAALFSTILITTTRWFGKNGITSSDFEYAKVVCLCAISLLLTGMTVVLTAHKIFKRVNADN